MSAPSLSMIVRRSVILGSLAMALVACDGASHSASDAGTTLILARSSDPEWLNPVAGHQHPDADLALFRGLFRLTENGQLAPDVAQDWSVTPDGLTYTIRLRQGVRWHDGQPLTAADVKFTLDTILNPANHSGLRAQLRDIARVEVVDEHTANIVLSRPLASLPAKLQVGLIPRHRLEGRNFNTDPFSQESPIGTGPFMFQSRERGQYLLYVANPDFYTGKSSIDRLIYKIIPDPNVRLVELLRGDIDVARLDPKDVAALDKNPDVVVQTLDSADFRVMMFNYKYPPFRDLRVRRAIQYATDRQALVDGALRGYGVPAYGPLQMLPVSAPDLPKFDNDLQKANELLREAGWTPGADGILVKDGVRLSFPLLAPTNDATRQDLATLLSSQLRRVGIDAVVQFKDWKAFRIEDATALILGGGAADDPDNNLYRYYSSRLGSDGTNFSSYHNPRVDELLETARNTLDPEARAKLYRELQHELIMDPPYNFLVYLKHVYGVRKQWTGFKPRLAGHGTTPLWNIEEWTYTGPAESRDLPTSGKYRGLSRLWNTPDPHDHDHEHDHDHGDDHGPDGH
ncbi:MAG: ABC transporter substrate-binding protein [Sinobacteraceae bacterium]|nr:ABC transporter substrate-binding protein [Nevskiaceae bacterium]